MIQKSSQVDRSTAKIVFVSTYPPRECGIATYSKSFARIFDDFYMANPIKMIAISDVLNKYKYSKRVIYEINQNDRESYIKAAEFINNSQIEIVCLQHEYGIFGGEDGEYILNFLENINKPVIVSLHSVLKKECHSPHRYKLTQRILDLSDSVIVMTKNAKEILCEDFLVTNSKIKIVPHGVPNIRFDAKKDIKNKLGYQSKIVLSTFGLINRGKGIELVIHALNKLVRQFPNIQYLIIGATHPTILKNEGEKYRNHLKNLVKKYHLEKNVKFINKYLEYSVLVDYLQATDVYLAIQTDLNQAFSGTLSYALGCGDAVVASPTFYAKEILASERGILVNPDKKDVYIQLEKLLKNEKKLKSLQLRGYQYARKMIWPQVGLDYLREIEDKLYCKNEKWKQRLPNLKEAPSLKHLLTLTDDFGIVQHAKGKEPDYRFGYCLDDVARGIIVSVKYNKSYKNSKVKKILSTYFKFLQYSIDIKGKIHNFFNKNKKYSDANASEDSLSRGFWSLAYLINNRKILKELKINIDQVQKLYDIYEKNIVNLHIQPIAFNLMGYCLVKDIKKIKQLADLLVLNYKKTSTNGHWHWFEDRLTWGNAIVPYSLIKAYQMTKNQNYLAIALKSLRFLESATSYKGVPLVIGQEEWYYKDKKRAMFDQQSIDAADMIVLYNELFFLTKKNYYLNQAKKWFGWFYGNNITSTIMYDYVSGGVYDGLTRRGVNTNQGAESILTYLLAYLSFNKGL